jgi:hypothetical protein
MEETSREVERDFGTGPSVVVLVVGREADCGAAAVIKASEE